MAEIKEALAEIVGAAASGEQPPVSTETAASEQPPVPTVTLIVDRQPAQPIVRGGVEGLKRW
jgi:hypothetical protein